MSLVDRTARAPALAGLAAFALALAADLFAKTYVVHARAELVVYNHRPGDLALRVAVTTLATAVVYAFGAAGRLRGLGRLWGGWIGLGVLTAGTLGNGVSRLIWDGVPDFIRMSDGWVWNLADFEIAFGLMGTAVAIVVSAVLAYARGFRSVRNVIE